MRTNTEIERAISEESSIHHSFLACRCYLCKARTLDPVIDGIADSKRFWSTGNKRILFVLKEANSEKGGWDLRDYARNGGRPATWNNLARWIAAAHNESMQSAITQSERAAWLSRAAFVNLKKVPGGATADKESIRAHAMAHKDLIRKQLALCSPEITIACGTHGILCDIFDPPDKPAATCEDGLYFFKDKSLGIVMDFFHPNCRKSSDELLGYMMRNLKFHGVI